MARAAAYRGFTTAIPSVEKACAILHATARRSPLGRAAVETLELLLRLLPRRCWNELPVLRITNATLANRVGCCERQVQRHLAIMHQHGVIGIHWGRGNTRLRFDVHGSNKDAPSAVPGIDLRPALVFAHEQQQLNHAVRAAQQRCQTERQATLDAIWQAKRALILHEQELGPARHAQAAQRIAQLRHAAVRIWSSTTSAKAAVAEIEAAVGKLTAIAGEAGSLHRRLIHRNGDDPEENLTRSPSPADQDPNQTTNQTTLNPSYRQFKLIVGQQACQHSGRPEKRPGGKARAKVRALRRRRCCSSGGWEHRRAAGRLPAAT